MYTHRLSCWEERGGGGVTRIELPFALEMRPVPGIWYPRVPFFSSLLSLYKMFLKSHPSCVKINPQIRPQRAGAGGLHTVHIA